MIYCLDAAIVDEYCMTKQELMDKYGIKSEHIPALKEYVYPEVNHGKIRNFDWNGIFVTELNKKFGGSTKKMISTLLRHSMLIICYFISTVLVIIDELL